MKITGLYFKNFNQFRNVQISLDKDISKFCLIGQNGTGKSTILKLLSLSIRDLEQNTYSNEMHELFGVDYQKMSTDSIDKNSFFGIRIYTEEDKTFFIFYDYLDRLILTDDFFKSERWSDFWNSSSANDSKNIIASHHIDLTISQMISLKADIVSYSANETSSPLITDDKIKSSNLNDALQIFNHNPVYHEIKQSTVTNFWNFLIYLVKKKESKYQDFMNSPEIENLSVKDAKIKFDKSNPDILSELSIHWDKILTKANLEFDFQHAKIPVQLSENLEVYIKIINSRKKLKYSELSSGIMNYIFRIGHIFILYFDRFIKKGFLFIDEPESNLSPDFVYDIVDYYKSVTHNTQIFMATHSPIVAAQFKPEERIILEFNDDGSVSWRSGISPEGDDPNDLLLRDFHVRHLYGAKGIEQWSRFMELRKQIKISTDPDEKQLLLKEYAQIGNAYNFSSEKLDS